MDKDRIKGSAQQAKGKIKEVAGKATGDKKLEGDQCRSVGDRTAPAAAEPGGGGSASPTRPRASPGR